MDTIKKRDLLILYLLENYCKNNNLEENIEYIYSLLKDDKLVKYNINELKLFNVNNDNKLVVSFLNNHNSLIDIKSDNELYSRFARPYPCAPSYLNSLLMSKLW